MSKPRQFLRQIVCREIKTLYTVSEMLECGHRFESETLLADALIAKRRICPKCGQAAASLEIPKKANGSGGSTKSLPALLQANRRAG